MLNKFKEVVPPLAIVPEVADIAETASTQLTPLSVLSCHLYLTVPVAPFLSTALEVKGWALRSHKWFGSAGVV